MADKRASARDCSVAVSTEPPDWSEYLVGRPDVTIYNDVRWGQVMAAAYGNRAYYLTASRQGRTVGVLQLVAQKSLLFGSHLCSLPYFDTAGILADDRDAADALLAQARSLMADLGTRWVELRQAEPLPGDLPSRTDKVTLRLPLPNDPEVLWKALDAKVRNQVRKGQKENLTVHQGGADLLPDFYAIYARTMRDLGSPLHHERFFRLILEQFGPAVRLFVVRSGDRPLAASLTLADALAVRVPWAGNDWRVRQSCANMLLYWSMLEHAGQRGAPCFDFGRSTRDSGTYRFKSQWGAKEVPLYWFYILRPGDEIPDLRPESPKYRLARTLWRRLPLSLACLIGPRIIARLS
ncbi:MAG: FemAB family PEP-CTERM system-associated protein [Planctomycetes bacterium]|nr:FemAB family PEP-CTERM system-associated protein [Planctomycetota bacterium]